MESIYDEERCKIFTGVIIGTKNFGIFKEFAVFYKENGIEKIEYFSKEMLFPKKEVDEQKCKL